MLSLQAIEKVPELLAIERSQICVVGSLALALYKDLAEIPASEYHVHIDDLDLSVFTETLLPLLARAKKKSELPDVRDDWWSNKYSNVVTVRRNVEVPGLKRPVQLDIGSGAHIWTHEELLSDALPYVGTDVASSGYSVISPHKQLAWYKALSYRGKGREKDKPKIEILREVIIPRLEETIGLARPS